ncbi:MAG: hypothetical protein ACR2KZ_11895 [Segetibacter sp.]
MNFDIIRGWPVLQLVATHVSLHTDIIFLSIIINYLLTLFASLVFTSPESQSKDSRSERLTKRPFATTSKVDPDIFLGFFTHD